MRFDGSSPYPLEFLRERTEIKERYYDDSEIRWIDKHLERETDVWWRITSSQVSSYEDFIEVFTSKYWNNKRQELVRGNMENGKFRTSEHGDAVQYLEKKILEVRHLTPRIL